MKTLIDLNKQDESADGPQNRDSGNSNSDDGPTSNADDSQQNTSTDDTQSQSRVGGAVGPGQTLDQQSLEQNGGSNSTSDVEADQLDSPPVNASERPDSQASDIALQNQHNTAHPSPADESSNPVLSPYSEQWLRELPQDPGGYLRRKFQYLYQTQQSEQPEQSNSLMRY